MKLVLIFALVFVVTASVVGNEWNSRYLENCGHPSYELYTSNQETFGNGPERVPFVGLSLQPGLQPEDFARLKAIARRVAPLPPDPSPALYVTNGRIFGNTPYAAPLAGLSNEAGGARAVQYGRLIRATPQMPSHLPSSPSPTVAYASYDGISSRNTDRIPFVGHSLQLGLRPEDFARLKAVARRVAPLPPRR